MFLFSRIFNSSTSISLKVRFGTQHSTSLTPSYRKISIRWCPPMIVCFSSRLIIGLSIKPNFSIDFLRCSYSLSDIFLGSYNILSIHQYRKLLISILYHSFLYLLQYRCTIRITFRYPITGTHFMPSKPGCGSHFPGKLYSNTFRQPAF